MHSLILVITPAKPTDDVLAAALAPFREKEDVTDKRWLVGYWDDWALGGRYTGQLIPHDVADTVTGGNLGMETDLIFAGVLENAVGDGDVTLQIPSDTGPGVDACRYSNLKELPFVPNAVLIDGHWHRPEQPDQRRILSELGFEIQTDGDGGWRWRPKDKAEGNAALERYQEEQRAAWPRWVEKVAELMRGVPPDHWVSVVDTHS
jgi:hypothetical protein